LSEPLHWLMSVTRDAESMVKVPLPDGQASSEQMRVTVVVELTTPWLMVFTTVTEQSMPVVAPPGPGPTALHWSIVAALAGGAMSTRPPRASGTIAAAKATTARRQLRRRDPCGDAASVDMTRRPL
jgi:hypothetical protein